jgi:hypothetical protein
MSFLPVLSGIGDIVGIIGSINQQNQQKQLGNQLGSLLTSDQNTADQLLQSYTGFTLPQLQQVISTLSPEQQQAWSSALSSLTQASGAATNLQNNPYLAPTANVANTLLNFNPLTTSQLNQLSTQAGGAANSAAATARAQMGGVANPAALYQSLVDQAGGVSDQAAVNLGAQTAAQRLNAVTQGGSLLNAVGSQYLSGQGGAGSLFQGIGNTYGGLSSEAMDQILQSLNISSQTLPAATNLLGQNANILSGLVGGTGNAGSNLPGLFGNLGTNLSTLFGGGGGGGGGYNPYASLVQSNVATGVTPLPTVPS